MGTKKGGCESGAHLRNLEWKKKHAVSHACFLCLAWCGETAEQSSNQVHKKTHKRGEEPDDAVVEPCMIYKT